MNTIDNLYNWLVRPILGKSLEVQLGDGVLGAVWSLGLAGPTRSPLVPFLFIFVPRQYVSGCATSILIM